MIKLDFFKLIQQEHVLGADEQSETDCRFTPYQIFVLETRLYPLIYRMFPDRNLEIYLKSEYNRLTNRMDIYLTIKELLNTSDPYLENSLLELTPLEIEKIQKKIDEINSYEINYALIDSKELYDSMNHFVDRKHIKNTTFTLATDIPKISFTYFQKMLEYTGLDSGFNPFIRPEGIYLTFNPISDYKPAYYEVSKFLIDKIVEFYVNGVVILDDIIDSKVKEEFIKAWKLKAYDEEEKIHRIYYPDWQDARFARNPVDFLTRKIEGDTFIRIPVSDNFVKRHGIAKAFQKENKGILFEGSYLKIQVNGLEEAQKYASLKVAAEATSYGKVLTISASRLSEIYLYFDYVEKKYGKGKSVTYYLNNIENPYMFSVMLPEDEYDNLDEIRKQFREFVLNRLVDVSKVTKLKNMSPHDIIIQEYS